MKVAVSYISAQMTESLLPWLRWSTLGTFRFCSSSFGPSPFQSSFLSLTSSYPNRKGCDKTSQKALFPFVNYLITSKLVIVVYLGWMLGQTAITVLILIINKLTLTAPWETDSHTTDTTSIEEDLLTRTATYSHKLVASALCLTTANRTCSFMPWLELNYYWLSCLATNSKLGFGYFTTTTLLNQLIKGRIQQGCGQGEGYQLYSPTYRWCCQRCYS